MCLVLTGCDLKVIVRRERQKNLLSPLGIATVEEEYPADIVDIVVDVTGSSGGFAEARNAVHPRGKIVLKSTFAGALDLDASVLVIDEITLIGPRCGTFPPALRLLETFQVDPTVLDRRDISSPGRGSGN